MNISAISVKSLQHVKNFIIKNCLEILKSCEPNLQGEHLLVWFKVHEIEKLS